METLELQGKGCKCIVSFENDDFAKNKAFEILLKFCIDNQAFRNETFSQSDRVIEQYSSLMHKLNNEAFKFNATWIEED